MSPAAYRALSRAWLDARIGRIACAVCGAVNRSDRELCRVCTSRLPGHVPPPPPPAMPRRRADGRCAVCRVVRPAHGNAVCADCRHAAGREERARKEERCRRREARHRAFWAAKHLDGAA